MTTYNNLEIAEVSLTFSGPLNTSISSRTFDLSTLSFLPNVPLIDQIEVERIFDTGYDTKFGANVFTIADRRQMFILPKAWYTINEQTKILTVVDLSTIPTALALPDPVYYPESRTYILETLDSDNNIQTIDIPNFLVNNVGLDTPYIRQPDTVIIRRKTLSLDSIVTFAPGTRLTTTQLNLQFNQLKYIIQELLAKIRNEAILKFDENAIDGPFLGGSDLKMSNNYIKDLNSKSIGEVDTQFSTGLGNSVISGSTYAANIGVVYNALTLGTVRRTTMNGGTAVPFSGHFTATPNGGSPLRITNMANAVDDTDAATLGQIRNASNLTQGTLDPARINNGTLPLTKLSAASGQGYTLPVDALANSGATENSYGASSASNTNNMVYMTVDAKGRTTAIGQRSMTVDDMPTSGVSAATYGDSTTPLVQLTVDSKGRITGASERAIAAADLPNINADNINSGTLNVARLATSGVTAGTTSIPNSITVDDKGRVTGIAGGSIPAANVSGFDTQVQTNKLNQMATPTASVSFGNQKITNLDTPTASADAATKGYVDGYAAPLSTFNTNVTNLIQTNSVYWDNSNNRYTAQRSGVNKKITGVDDPTTTNDAVNLNYFNTNALAISGGLINANSNPIINVTMRSGGSLAANDAVNYGFVQALTLYGQAVTDPQTFTNAWPTAGSLVNGNLPYEFSLATLAATTAEMVIVTDSQGRIYIPSTAVPAAAGRFFRLDTSVSPKKIIVYLESTTTPTGSVYIRNFGTSRSVSASIAGAATLGLVQVPTTGGLLINSSTGDITLNTATSSQIGGIKLGDGLFHTGSSVVKVDLSDSTSLNNSVKVASSKAVKDTYDYAVGVNSSLSSLSSTVSSVNSTATAAQNTANAALARSGGTMSGKLITVTPASGSASIVLPSGSAPNVPVSGDVWNNAGTLQFYNGSTTKTLAFTDSSITGNAATATQWSSGRNITLTGAVAGVSGSFNGTADLSFATTLSSSAAVISLQGTANQVLVNGTSGTPTAGAITLTLPQSIHTAATPTFAGLTSNNVQVGNTSGTITTTTTNQNLILSANGTGLVNIADNADIDGTLNVDGASTLVGNATMQGSVSVTAGASKIALGADASTATTSINRQNTTASPASIGDLILRVPASGKAFLIANNTIATAAGANDQLITQGVLTAALGSYATTASLGSYMATSGTLVTAATNQVLGTGAGATGSFIVKTANTDRLTINAAGTTSLANGLSVTGTIAATGKITSAATESSDTSTTVMTKGYTESYVASVFNNITATAAVFSRLTEVQVSSSFSNLTAGTYNLDLSTLDLWKPYLFKFGTDGSATGNRVINFIVEATESFVCLAHSAGGSGVTFNSTLTTNLKFNPFDLANNYSNSTNNRTTTAKTYSTVGSVQLITMTGVVSANSQYYVMMRTS